ncbi:MAG: phytanoyl-CoA dioxygenase family protein [Caulobacterales bacterium]
MSELDALQVFGETSVGWCAATPPNESADEGGAPVLRDRGVGAADPRAPARRVYDDPEVCALRERLRQGNGLTGLEIVQPHEVARAARIFFRDGFVVVEGLLDPDRLARLREASARVLRQILEIPGVGGRKYLTESLRLPHRYSFGTASASRHMLHDANWAALIDLPTTTPILTEIFGGEDYWVFGAGGDLCLPGAIEYQILHSDRRESYALPAERIDQARRMGLELKAGDGGDAIDHPSRQRIFERTPPVVTINFLASDLTWENGPIRQIPGTQARPDAPPSAAEEPEWMRLSILVGAPAGAGVIRDNRAWHGGTPNLSREVRAMPNVEYGAPWLDAALFKPSMPHEVWAELSAHAQRLSLRVKTQPGVWPEGAGAMHPLTTGRTAAKSEMRSGAE